MNIKLVSIITILSLCFLFGFKTFPSHRNEINNTNIDELEIVKYLPKDNNQLFISNSQSSNVINNIKRIYTIENQDKLILVKDSILSFLGLDLGGDKLEDIYNGELAISTYRNKEKDIEKYKEDVLIIFKIDEGKNIDDILNLKDKVDKPEKIIEIYRENKLNYLNYIYRTNDNYIIVSSNEDLIRDSIKANQINKKRSSYYKKLLQDFKKENNILLTQNFEINQLLNNKYYYSIDGDYIATIFHFKNKNLFLESYLINNNKNLNIKSYDELVKDKILDNNYKIVIYDDLNHAIEDINNIKNNNFETSILQELNKKLKENILLLISEKNWIIIFENNNKINFSMNDINILKDFNKYSLEKNDIIFTIYSKDILRNEDNIVKQIQYKKFFTAETDQLNIISNSLINDINFSGLSKTFFDNKGNINSNYLLNKKINLKSPYYYKTKNLSYLDEVNSLFKNIINISVVEFRALIKQTIPDRNPIFYTETNLKFLDD